MTTPSGPCGGLDGRRVQHPPAGQRGLDRPRSGGCPLVSRGPGPAEARMKPAGVDLGRADLDTLRNAVLRAHCLGLGRRGHGVQVRAAWLGSRPRSCPWRTRSRRHRSTSAASRTERLGRAGCRRDVDVDHDRSMSRPPMPPLALPRPPRVPSHCAYCRRHRWSTCRVGTPSRSAAVAARRAAGARPRPVPACRACRRSTRPGSAGPGRAGPGRGRRRPARRAGSGGRWASRRARGPAGQRQPEQAVLHGLAAAPRWAPKLARMCSTWVEMVRGLPTRQVPTSASEHPAVSSVSTSSSRAGQP